MFQRAEEFGFETLILAPDAPLWNDIERLAQRYRVYVAAINRPDGYQSADALAQAVAGRGDRVGAAIDTGRLVSAGQSPAQAVAKLKTRLFAVHLSDVTAAGGFCPLGQGSVDFPALFTALTEAGYDDLITVTCDGFAQNAEALADSLEYLKKITGGK